MTRLWVVVLAIAGFPACHAGSVDTRASRTVAVAPRPAIEGAVVTIAEARCAAQQRCNGSGALAGLPSSETCMEAMLNDSYAELSRCRRDVVPREMAGCLSDVESRDCSAPLVGLSGIEDCSAEALCLD